MRGLEIPLSAAPIIRFEPTKRDVAHILALYVVVCGLLAAMCLLSALMTGLAR